MPRITSEGAEVQFAALPFRIKSGTLQMLLITSRGSQRWVIPKGWPIRGLRPREVAAREALEEAGVAGRIVGKRSIGSYHYCKQLPDNQEALCRVKVFLLSVDHQLDQWPEKAQRACRWVTPEEALAWLTKVALLRFFAAPFRRSNSMGLRRASDGACRTDAHMAIDGRRHSGPG